MIQFFLSKKRHSKKFFSVMGVFICALLFGILSFVNTNVYANFVTNPSFESGTSTWYFYLRNGAAGTFTTTTSTAAVGATSAYVNVSSATSDPHDAELANFGASVVAGQTYTVSFWARGGVANRPMDVVAQNGDAPYKEYMRKSILLPTTWQQYTYTFVSSETKSNAYVGFQFGEGTGAGWVDDVKFYQGTAAPNPTPTLVPTPTSAAGPTTPNIIKNSGCELDTSDWHAYQATIAKVDGVAHSGTASCFIKQVTGTSYTMDDNNDQVINPKQGDTYTASAWVRSDTAIGKPVYLTLRLWTGSTAKTVYGTPVNLTTNWQEVKYTITVDTATRTGLDYYIAQENAAAGESFYADDMGLYLGSTIPAPTPTPPPVSTQTYETITQRSASSSPSDSSGTTLSLATPLGTVAGDVMVAHIVVNASATTIAPPSGWNLVRRTNTSSSSMASAIYYKTATASEPSSHVWTFDTTRTSAGGIASYTNVDTVNPIDAHSGIFNSNSSNMTAPSVTTTTDADMLLYIGAATAGSPVSGPSGMSPQWRVGSASMSYLATKLLTAAGATGAITATNTLTGESNVAHLVALLPRQQVQSTAPTYKNIILRSEASANNGTGSNTLTLAKPAGSVTGDVMVAHIVVEGSSTLISPPAGWTLIRRDNTTTSLGSALYYKVFGTSEPTSYVWTFNSSKQASGGIVSYINVNNATPIDAHSGLTHNNLTTMTASSIITSTDADRLLFFGSVDGNATVTAPIAMFPQWNATTSLTTSFLGEKGLTAKGSTGDLTGNHNASGKSNVAQLVALKPVVGTATVPIVYVQSNVSKNDGSPTSVTLSQPVTAGNLLVVAVSNYLGALSVSDNRGNTYKLATALPSVGDGTEQIAIYYVENAIGGATTITASSSVGAANTSVSLAAHEYSGIAKTNALDKVNTAGGNSISINSGNTATTTQADELVFGAGTHGAATNVSISAGSGFTARRIDATNAVNFFIPIFTEDRIVAATSNYSAPFTASGAVPWKAAVATFKAEVVSVSGGGGGGGGGGPVSPAPFGSVVNLNFNLSNFNPWIQSVCGDMRIDSGIDDQLPLGQYAITSSASCPTPGVAYSGDASYSFGEGQVSNTNQIVGGLAYPEVYEPPQKVGIFSSYSNMTQKVLSSGMTSQPLPCTLSNCILPLALAEGIYVANGDVSLNSYSFLPNNNYIVLVNGNLTINGNLTTGSGTTVLYAVSGNIIIPSTLGVAPTVTTPNLEGIFSTDKSFIVNSTNVCSTELRLNIEGSLIVNAARSGGSLQNGRDLCGNNLTSPSMQLTQRLDYILNIPEFLRIQRVTSNEVAP